MSRSSSGKIAPGASPGGRSPHPGTRRRRWPPRLALPPSPRPMRRPLALFALLALTPVASAQTCGGLLSFTLGERQPASADTLRPWPASQYDVTATAVAPPMTGQRLAPDVAGRPSLDALSRRADVVVLRDTLAGGRDGLFWPRDEITTWTRCGFVLLRYEITGYDGRSPAPVMVLDLYNVPPHGGIEAEGLLPFRPGRWTFDFADGAPFAAEALRAEPE